jgi:acetyl esterase
VVGGLESHDGVARFLCKHAGCSVLAVDYRLAPEHRFPAAVEDAWAALKWVGDALELGFKWVAVGGDSSGGNLAAVVARRARDWGLRLRLQLLVYPALDLVAADHEAGEFSYWVGEYVDPAGAADPDASPMRAEDLHGLAPGLILSCGLDPLRHQAEAYASRLREAGVAVRHTVYPDLIHTAYRMPAILPGARRMLADSAAALAEAFAGA